MYNDLKIAEWINQNRIKGLDGFFIFLTDTAGIIAYAIPLLIIFYALYKKDLKLRMKGLQILCTILASTITVQIIKYIVHRQRPYEVDKLIEKLSFGGGYSFPSGHTADVFSIAISVTMIISSKKWVLIPLWIWAILVAYSRMLLGVHYLTDITASIFICLLFALLMQALFKKKKQQPTA
jgi:undecaprenyl-diphosphatase